MLKHGALYLLLEFMKPLEVNLLDRTVLNRAYEAAKVFGNIVEACTFSYIHEFSR
jgi:hypothetical protein